MSLQRESCCCDMYDGHPSYMCDRCDGDRMHETEFHDDIQLNCDADFAGSYNGLLSSEYDFGVELEEQYEEEFGSYASVAGNLSHVGSQLEFDELDAFSNGDGETAAEDAHEIEEDLTSDLLESLTCLHCGSINCSICFPSELAASPDVTSLWARRPGPLARFRPGQWLRRRVFPAADKPHAGAVGGGGGFLRFNPLRRLRFGRAPEFELAAAQEDGKLPARCGWGMGMGLGRLRRARRLRVEQERPMKRHFFVILLCVGVLTCGLFWRQLGLRKLALRAMHGAQPEEQVCRRSTLSAGPWRYCGPHNGHDFSRVPVDTLDAICAQHDFCIEKAEYVVEGQRRFLYPMGEQDADKFLRCGIPMRSHTDPTFGCQINACDTEMFNSLHTGFSCSPDASLPKSPWCSSPRFLQRMPCAEYASFSNPFLLPRFLACRAVARVSQAYHGWKIRNTCSFMSQHMMDLLAELELELDEEDSLQLEEQFGSVNSDPDSDLNLNLDAGPGRSHSPTGSPEGHKSRGRFRRLAPVRRLLGRVWNVLRRGRWHVIPEEAGTDSDSSEASSVVNWLARPGGWNCTCQVRAASIGALRQIRATS